jgi:hypothetical protein
MTIVFRITLPLSVSIVPPLSSADKGYRMRQERLAPCPEMAYTRWHVELKTWFVLPAG